jgi:putative FmdB family regulatory protein
MPIYTFICKNCEHTFDSLQPYGHLPKCEKCGGECEKPTQTFGGYKMNGSNTASTRPKGAGYRK